ncbi:CPBP family intramembrane glutamic endopeptidase [Gemmatimonas sp.]|uniref:CPBP family intramembrane glutamic endopeptidase n=1 Tax=Gemmatimonas sp. TaxID=1962908 RepID=UPI003983D728
MIDSRRLRGYFTVPSSSRSTSAVWPTDATVFAVLAWTSVALVVVEFLLIPFRTARLWPNLLAQLAPGVRYGTIAAAPATLVRDAPWWGALATYAWWTVGMLLFWVAVPAAILSHGRAREDGREGGRKLPFTLRVPFTRSAWLPYLLLILVMLPLLALASTQAGFLTTYPMLRPSQTGAWSWTLLLLYWTMYATVLACTEFLFRGVLLFTLESRLGVNAVLVSVLPYCLIHVHKPLLEALGSIVAGIVLGVLALRTRSIGGGVVVHVAVALGMDALALVRTGGFPQAFWP